MSNIFMRDFVKKIQTGVDIGQTFFMAIHEKCDMLSVYDHSDLRILAPKYFIDILQSGRMNMPGANSFDPEGYFIFMGISMLPSPFEKIIIYHVDYPLRKREDMYHEFDLSILVS